MKKRKNITDIRRRTAKECSLCAECRQAVSYDFTLMGIVCTKKGCTNNNGKKLKVQPYTVNDCAVYGE